MAALLVGFQAGESQAASSDGAGVEPRQSEVTPASGDSSSSTDSAGGSGAESASGTGQGSAEPEREGAHPGSAAALREPGAKRFTLALSLPLGTYTRRRLSEEGASTYRMTGVQGVLANGPTLRGFYAVSHWLHLGVQLSGGFATVNVDGSPDTESLVMVGLDAAARVTPWAPPWGQPQLTLAVGGRYFDGYFIDESRPSTSISGFSPVFSADAGVVFWLLGEVIGVELGAGAAYAFGPASFEVETAGAGYLQQLDLSIESGLLARF